MISPWLLSDAACTRCPTRLGVRAEFFDGDGEVHGRPLSDVAVDPDATAVRIDDRLADGESEPDAVLRPRPTRTELVEHVRQLVGGNALAGVGDPEREHGLSLATAPTTILPAARA